MTQCNDAIVLRRTLNTDQTSRTAHAAKQLADWTCDWFLLI